MGMQHFPNLLVLADLIFPSHMCHYLDMSRKSIGQGINDADLYTYEEMVKVNDIILLYTRTSDSWTAKNEKIRKNFTYLEPSAAK